MKFALIDAFLVLSRFNILFETMDIKLFFEPTFRGGIQRGYEC